MLGVSGRRRGDAESICFKAGILRDMDSFRAGRAGGGNAPTLLGTLVLLATVFAGQADKPFNGKRLSRDKK
jgi:hypothetical protein